MTPTPGGARCSGAEKVGTGLVLSALTDTCTMGRILVALPYNRGPRDRTPAEVLAQLPTTQLATTQLPAGEPRP